MKNKKPKKKRSYFWVWIIIFIVGLMGILYLENKEIRNNDKQEEVKIDFSSEEYKDIDLWKENITFEARDYDGNLVTGIAWFGVNGIYSKERPLIFGENEYTYWSQNDSYIIIPEKLIPDTISLALYKTTTRRLTYSLGGWRLTST